MNNSAFENPDAHHKKHPWSHPMHNPHHKAVGRTPQDSPRHSEECQKAFKRFCLEGISVSKDTGFRRPLSVLCEASGMY